MIALPQTMGSMTKGLGSLPIPRPSGGHTTLSTIFSTDESFSAAPLPATEYWDVSCWLYLPSGAPGRSFVCITKASAVTFWTIASGGSGQLYVEIGNQSATSRRYIFPSGDYRGAGWTHVIASKDDQGVRLMINGVEKTGQVNVGALPDVTAPSHSFIGAFSYNGVITTYLTGQICEPAYHFTDTLGDLWDATEKAEIYNGGKTWDMSTATAPITRYFHAGSDTSGGASALVWTDTKAVGNITATNMTQDDNVIESALP